MKKEKVNLTSQDGYEFEKGRQIAHDEYKKEKIKKVIIFTCIGVLAIAIIGLIIGLFNKETESEETIVKEEILEGIVDGYKFTVTDEVTDRVRIQMNNGDIMLIVLSNSQTPITIENFKNHVQKGTYN